jgi:hypothetical protein
MPSCPSCSGNVPTNSLLQATGIAGVVCPYCNMSLWPKYWSSVLLLVVSSLLATLAHILAHHAGVGFPVDLVIWVIAFVFCYVLFSPLLLRLRLKESPDESLRI